MRLRLRCSSAYALGDFQRSMVHVPEHALTVGAFAAHVVRVLGLEAHGGNGFLPQLLLDGFLIPHSEELRVVLRDDEVVDVERSDRVLGLSGLRCTGAAVESAALLDASNSPAAKRIRTGDGKAAVAVGWQAPPSRSLAMVPVAHATSFANGRAAEDEDSWCSSAEENLKSACPAASSPAPAKIAIEQARRAALGTCEAVAAAVKAGKSDEVPNCEGTRSIFVGGLPESVDDKGLQEHFSRFGGVTKADVVYNPKTQKSKCFGFVEFSDAATCAKACAQSSQEISGKRIEIRLKQSKGGGKAGFGRGKDIHGGNFHAGSDKTGKGKGGKGNSAPLLALTEGSPPIKKVDKCSSSSSDEEEAGEGPKPIPHAKASGTVASVAGNKAKPASATEGRGVRSAAKTAAPPAALDREEEELQRQMAALGLPVSFTARPQDDEEEDDDDDDE